MRILSPASRIDFCTKRPLWPVGARRRLAALCAIFAAIPAVGAPPEATWLEVQTKSESFAINPATGERFPLRERERHGAVSPDGLRIAYASAERGSDTVDLFVADAASTPRGAARRMTEGLTAVSDIAWFPDSRRIAYVADSGPDARVWVLDAGPPSAAAPPPPAPRRIGSGERRASQPAISAGGTLAFLEEKSRRGKDVRYDLVLADGVANRAIVKDEPIFSFSWRPDGQALAVATIDRVTIRTLDGAAERVLALGDVEKGMRSHSAYELAWRPDGKAIAAKLNFLGGRMGDARMPSDEHVYVIPMEGTAIRLAAPPLVQHVGWIAPEDAAARRISPSATQTTAPPASRPQRP